MLRRHRRPELFHWWRPRRQRRHTVIFRQLMVYRQRYKSRRLPPQIAPWNLRLVRRHLHHPIEKKFRVIRQTIDFLRCRRSLKRRQYHRMLQLKTGH